MRSVFRPRYLLLALLIAGVSLPLLQRAATAHSPQSATAPSRGAIRQPVSADTRQMNAPAPTSSTTSGTVPGPAARDVIAAAQALPSDFQADVLLRIATATDVPVDASGNRTAATQRLVQQASILAERAQRRLPGLASVGYIREEHADELHAPFTAGLDRLSLQTRAAQLAPPAQPETLFAALPKPQAGSCDAPYLDDPSPTYALASALLPAQAAARAAALAKRVDAAQHETDVAPALKMILASAVLEKAEQAQLADNLARMFDRIRNDDPGFTATELSIAGDVPLLLQQLQDPALRERLQRAYRGYVAAHLAQNRCPTSVQGNHWMLEQLYVAELPDERIVDAPPAAAPSLDDQAVSLIRQAGHNIRTQLLDPSVHGNDADVEKASMEFLDQLDHGVLQQTASNDDSGRVQRARLRELLRYLEYAPASAARDRGMGILAPLLSGPYYARDHDTWFGDLRMVADQLQRWPDRDQRLAQLVEHADPVVKVYAMLMQRRQFP
ncbi:hypothetical protein [Xanthomonas albilineans]|uniref:Secreted protein n=1 Tax=Xanthomonas albilineans (strain GPE PC73 / CFBP 7063) TaxID=380358 RepID=D2UB83_XANAP|nr:hypothetical protein [Xanthomonas albilineans]QHQ27286.1 hypothetical protein XaFJ1_GM000524 [Xanthomonas albilineans]CBA15079.1 hypothetical protein XALC_0550 [Xanthomonas albilineans GPE PC73]